MDAQLNSSEAGRASNAPHTADDLPALPASLEPSGLHSKPAQDPVPVSASLLGAPLSEVAAQNGHKPALDARAATPISGDPLGESGLQ